MLLILVIIIIIMSTPAAIIWQERFASLGVRYKVSGGDAADADAALTFVVVPASDALSPQELVLLQQAQQGDAICSSDHNNVDAEESHLDTFLQGVIALQAGETVDAAMVQQAADAARNCTTGLCTHVSPATFEKAAEQGTLQRIQLSSVSSSNSENKNDDAMTSIFMYYDESAHFKGRPRNARACQYAAAAKTTQEDDDKEEEPIHGDAYLIGRHSSTKKLESLEITDVQRQSWWLTK